MCLPLSRLLTQLTPQDCFHPICILSSQPPSGPFAPLSRTLAIRLAGEQRMESVPIDYAREIWRPGYRNESNFLCPWCDAAGAEHPKFYLPASRVFCMSQKIPFYVTLESWAASLATASTFGLASGSVARRPTQIKLMRQSTVDVRCVSVDHQRARAPHHRQ